MSLEFKSTVAERVTVLEQWADGRERIAIATRDPAGTNGFGDDRWQCEITHPSGKAWSETFWGNRVEVTAALGNWLRSKSQDFRDDKARGDRPVYEQSMPGHVPLGEDGAVRSIGPDLKFRRS